VYQHHGKDRVRSEIISQLNLTQQLPHLASVQSFGRQNCPLQFFDRLSRIGGNISVLDQPPEETANGDQIAVDRRHRLTTVSPQMVSEVSDVSGRDPTDAEPFAVAGGEPIGKLLDVLGERAPRMIRQIVGREEITKQGCFVSPGRNGVENIITTILHALFLQI